MRSILTLVLALTLFACSDESSDMSKAKRVRAVSSTQEVATEDNDKSLDEQVPMTSGLNSNSATITGSDKSGNKKVSEDLSDVQKSESAAAGGSSKLGDIGSYNGLTPVADNVKSRKRIEDCESIEELYEWNEDWQYFTIQPSKDTTLYCKKGTSIKVPRGSFNHLGTNRRAIKPITLKVREFQDLTDFILSPMTTQTAERLLETGGSLYIDAESQGEPLELVEERELEIGFPTVKEKEDMLDFYGFMNAEKQILWRRKATITYNEREFFGHMCSIYAMDEGFLRWQVEGGMQTIIDKTAEILKDSALIPEDGLWGDIVISCVMPGTGFSEAVEIKSSLHPALDKALAKMVEEIYWDPDELYSNRQGQQFRFRFYEGSRERSRHTVVFHEEYEDNVVTREVQLSKDAGDLTRYIVGAKRLGYINCDRFMGMEMQSLMVRIDDPGDNCEVNLVLNDYNAMMKAWAQAPGAYVFSRVPKGQNGKIVVIKEDGSELTYSVSSVRIGSPFEISEFAPFTTETHGIMASTAPWEL